jgi:LmbE family N-acetylglucosaminyl deacetylase
MSSVLQERPLAPHWQKNLFSEEGCVMAEEQAQVPRAAILRPQEPEGQRVLVVMAHPDDGEFNCGGTIARWARSGKEIYYCVVTDGNSGSSDPTMTPERLVALRHEEHKAAARTLGAREAIFLHYQDGLLEPTLELRRDIARLIRRLRPDAVICQDPTLRWSGQHYINHPDHRAAGEATLAAIMPAASTRLIFPELLAEGLEPHHVREIFIASGEHAETWVDITTTMETKIAALQQHKSQLNDWDPTEMLREWGRSAARQARAAGVAITEYAEGFKYVRLED